MLSAVLGGAADTVVTETALALSSVHSGLTVLCLCWEEQTHSQAMVIQSNQHRDGGAQEAGRAQRGASLSLRGREGFLEEETSEQRPGVGVAMRQMAGCRGGVRFTKHGKQHMRGVETENPG